MTPQQKKTPRNPGRVRRAVVAGAAALTLSAGGATAWALDRFVVQHVEIADVSAYEAGQSGTSAATSTGTGTTADPATTAQDRATSAWW